MNSNFIVEKHFSLSTHLLKEALHLKLTLEEFILLIYFEDSIDKTFNVSLIEQATSLKESTILNTFNSLMSKRLITIESGKDMEGRRTESVSLNPFYEKLEEVKEENLFAMGLCHLALSEPWEMPFLRIVMAGTWPDNLTYCRVGRVGITLLR